MEFLIRCGDCPGVISFIVAHREYQISVIQLNDDRGFAPPPPFPFPFGHIPYRHYFPSDKFGGGQTTPFSLQFFTHNNTLPSPARYRALEKFLNYLALMTRKRPPHSGHFLKRAISCSAKFQQLPRGTTSGSLHPHLTQWSTYNLSNG